MKNLIFINGTMGIGKTTTSKELQKLLLNCVFLDGDWCWDANPFVVTEETKLMVIENISYLLNNFLKCSEYKNVIFCWVMNEENIIEKIISSIETKNYKLHKFSLICDEKKLIERLNNDINNKIRDKSIVNKSILRLTDYTDMKTQKIDVSNVSPKEAGKLIYDKL